MSAPIPVHKQFTEQEKSDIVNLFESGKTQDQIGTIYNKPRRTIAKLLKHLELSRTASEAAKLAIVSSWDDPVTIEKVRELRPTHSLPQLVELLKIPLSSLERLCQRHNIPVPVNYAELQSKRMIAAWTDEKKAITTENAKALVTPELRRLLSEQSKVLWEDPDYRARQVATQREVWNRPENKERLANWRINQSGNISKIQQMLYDMLTDLNVEYKPEVVIGPYNFDCQVGDVLIECQGDYWHSQEKAIRLDRAKHSYITSYHEKYQIKYLWEHEFHCKDRVIETLKYWFNLTKFDIIDFSFGDVVIKTATAAEYKPLLGKYHYLSNAGRGGKAFGAYLNNELIAVCVFSPLVRQNIDTVGFEPKEVVELSRLCVHPKYQKHNFASWFVSRCIKNLDPSIKAIISYCDTTFNHVGAVYKALNFEHDRIIKSDYWYTDERGWVMHKKTLYERAVKMALTEADYAAKFGYKRVYGSEKFRFVFRR